MKKNNGILIRNGEHWKIRGYFRNDPGIHINYYECKIPSFGGPYCFSMVSFKDIDVRTHEPNLSEVGQLLNEQFNDLSFTFPLDPPDTECCCSLL